MILYQCVLISPEGVDCDMYAVEAHTRLEALKAAQKRFRLVTDERGKSDTGWTIDVFIPE